ncbi:16S rRNA (cytosine(1402)-N(4))-methyltransferase RsmH [Candidatus Borkfalkia ceftriaxoniphila]|jgi:S-adenosyl-methyltransferase mraW|uniref:Ribosomal RNA small subunit methyltransferase H n=1 Tax=Candidatus Borkfalkia ceftriaxoniphila TaxID=2508949 RepID=A0A4Q2K896_9FIRM|nr:16S rRNA (cytosine(1402)-N(4))-methyltransferase RsmH [Candidatus Borkfalkia ceftriaxoniphila]RXZ58203.1 16S rRNA (cytosine(1402)-N(4))-methyltransferase RsmH [Candidatus Borkfalkia ceftriaxoniphila]
MLEFAHKPVMLEECMAGLDIKSGGVYFDGTLGGGGHSYEILRRSAPDGRLIATDLDDFAIAAAGEKLKEFGNRFRIFKSNYKDYERVLEEANVSELDGVLLDFGVSSFQLDEETRGFSYMKKNAPLDMRMDPEAALSAREVVNGYSEQSLYEILRDYGEEKFAKKIAFNLVKERERAPVETAGRLVEIVEKSIPAKFKQNGPCARKTFQAIRIEVNGELDKLSETVKGLARKLKKGGRICILTFHSLEDRIVKNAFRDLETDCVCDKSLPVCVCGKKREIVSIGRKPLVAGEEEQKNNSRSKCAKLRIAERV